MLNKYKPISSGFISIQFFVGTICNNIFGILYGSYLAGFLDSVNNRVVVLAMTDTESEDADNHLLVDWKGNGGGSSFVQQKLPFKQAKHREGLKTSSALLPKAKETHTTTSAARVISTDVIVPVPDVVKHVPVIVEPIPDAVKRIPDVVTRPIVVVSLSDSDVSAPPSCAIKRPNNNSHRLNPSGSWSFTFSICCN